jgi:hypothetical protein
MKDFVFKVHFKGFRGFFKQFKKYFDTLLGGRGSPKVALKKVPNPLKGAKPKRFCL